MFSKEAIKESAAEGRYDHWACHVQESREGTARFLVDKSQQRRYYGTLVTYFYASQLRRRRVIGRWSRRPREIAWPEMCCRRKNIYGTFVRPEYIYRDFSVSNDIPWQSSPHRQNFRKRDLLEIHRNAVSNAISKSVIRSKDLFFLSISHSFQITSSAHSAHDVALDFTLFALRDSWIFNRLFSTNPASFAPPQTPLLVRSQSRLRWII